MDKKPWELDYATDGQHAGDAGVKPWQQYGGKPKEKGFVAKSLQTAGDLGVSLLSGAASVPDALVGLADSASTFLGVNNDKGNAVRKTLANDDGAFGFNPAQAKRVIDDWHSADYKDKQQQFAQANGVLAKTGVALSNPSLVANAVAESLPAMAAGGVAGMGARGLAAKAGMNMSARAAGAVGEGAMMAGQQAANIQEQTGGLTQGQAGASLLTGVLGGGIGMLGARAAQKMGIGDIDTALVSGSVGKIAPQSVPSAVIKGAVTEGLFEELPQSVMEQLIGNIATGKAWHDNLDGAAVMGVLSGAAMGGVFGAAQGKGWGKTGEWVGQWRNGAQSGIEDSSAVAADNGFVQKQQDSAPVRDSFGVLAAAQAQLAEQEQGGDVQSDDYAAQARRFIDARLAEKRAQDAKVQAESDLAESPDDEIWRSVGADNVPTAPKPSEQMGLNPDAGALQAAAAVAVDSGASPVANTPVPQQDEADEAAWREYRQMREYEAYEREQQREMREWALAVQRGMADGYSASQAAKMYDDVRMRTENRDDRQAEAGTVPQAREKAQFASVMPSAAPEASQKADVPPSAAQSEAAPPVHRPYLKQALPEPQAVRAEQAVQTRSEAVAEPVAKTQAQAEPVSPQAVQGRQQPSDTAESAASATHAQADAEAGHAAPVAVQKNVRKAKGRDAERTLVSDWGVRVDAWAVNDAHRGERETDNGVVGGVKDAFLQDAKAYLTALQHELADKGFVPQTNKRGKPHKVAVNRSGTGASGDAYLMMRRGDGGTPVYVTVGTDGGGSRPAVRFRVGDGAGGANHDADASLSAGSLATMVSKAVPQLDDLSEAKAEVATKEQESDGKQFETTIGTVHSGTGNSSERVSELAENGGKPLEAVSAENVSAVSTGGDSEVQAGNRGGDDVSGSGRAGDAGHESAASVGDGTGEVSAAAARNAGVAGQSAAEPEQSVKRVFADRADVQAVLSELGVEATVKNWDSAKGRRIYINLKGARLRGDKSYQLYYDVARKKLVSKLGRGSHSESFMDSVRKVDDFFEQLEAAEQAEALQAAATAADDTGNRSEVRTAEAVADSAAPAQPKPQKPEPQKTDEPKAGAPDIAVSDGFVITDDDALGQGGLKTKFKQNIEAVKILRLIQAENDRAATPAEQKVLAKWVGWGGLSAAFRREDGSVAKGWEREVGLLEQLLSADELRSARDSTIAAHYTSPEVVKAMWSAVTRMGFAGGRVLEPSVGSGNFIGLMPQDLRAAAAVHGTELDTVTGALAQKLYPAAAIKVMGFQDYDVPDGYFKLAIGNPPFGSLRITDNARRHLSGLSLHNYFFAKSVDALEDNGVLAMVVTSRFMDIGSSRARDYIAERTELLAAVRLPNNAFLKNANTQVTTDIVFLRKLPEAERGQNSGASWNAVKDYTDKNGNSLSLNVYFHEHPEMMLGEFGAFGSMYGPNEPALVAKDGQDTAALLEKALLVLPENVFSAPQKDETVLAKGAAADIGDVKVGSVFVRDGVFWRRLPDMLGEHQAEAVALPNKKAQERVAGLIGVRDALARVRRLQLTDGVPDAVLEKARGQLDGLYDDFVKQNGFINDEANKRVFRDDPSWSQLAALEEGYQRGISAAVAKKTGETPRKASAQKAAILSRRTQYPFRSVSRVESAKDGLVESLSSLGRLDVARIAALYGKPETDVLTELGDLVYQDPVSGWQTADEYLSGNVKEKLARAREAAASDGAFSRNVAALEKVQPADIEAVDIGDSARLGSHWIPPQYLRDFLVQVLGAPVATDLPSFNRIANEWTLPKFAPSQNANAQFGTEYRNVREVVSAAVNGKQMNVYDELEGGKKVLNQEASDDANKKADAVKQAWADWIWQDDERREAVARLYNDVFNTDVKRHYDGSHLKLAGKVDDSVIALRPTQKNAVWRITQNRTTLLDHVVGAGKTFTMVAAAMELRRMGLASKPMIVVPNHLVSQWGEEFAQLYPNADVLVAGKKDFEAGNRKRLVARIANGDWDAVIVAHSSFGKISVDKAFEVQFVRNQIRQIESAEQYARETEGRRSPSVKDLQKRRLGLQEKYKKLLAAANKDDDNLSWGELGIDALFVDEAHEFKNLAFVSTMRNVAGLGNQSGSQKAMDLYMKIQQLQQNPSSRVVFATGTPISNSMAEMYTMQRYLGEERLQRQGTNHFDAWAKTFGQVVSDWELSASGKYKLKSRFAKFVGLPELMQGYWAFADVINRDDINEALKAQGKHLPVPKIKGGAPENVVVPRSPFQADYIGVPVSDEHGNEVYPAHSLVYRAENLPKGDKAKAKGADNMLKIVGEARKLALDPRILDASAPDFENSKVNTAARRIVEIYRRWDKERGTQLVFSDLSTPKAALKKEKALLDDLTRRADEGDEAALAQLGKYSPDELDAIVNGGGFSVYDELKSKLAGMGIPEAEVAFIHDANTELQKAELFGKVRSGRVRVLIGSTSKMGAGTNVQNRLVALHHLDAPWRPSDLEQREGRIIRQGNELYAKDPEGFQVEVLRYATEQTMDAMQWQIIENKARFIEQVRKGDVNNRVIEDVGGEAANAAQMKAAASGNPLILEEMSLRKQLNDLEAEKVRHERNLFRVRSSMRQAVQEIERDRKRIAELQVLSSAKVPAKWEMTVGKKRFSHDADNARMEAGKALLSQVRAVAGSSRGKAVGRFGDFVLRLVPSSFDSDAVYLHLDYADADLVLEMKRDDSPGGILTRIQNLVKSVERQLADLQNRVSSNESSLPKMKRQLAEWDGAERLKALRQEHVRVVSALKAKKSDAGKGVKPEQPAQQADDTETDFSLGGTAAHSGGLVADYRKAVARAVGVENMRRIQVISRAQAKKKLAAKHHAYLDRVRGWYVGGKVVLVADNMASERVAQFTAWHELGHHGVKVSGWQDWRGVLNQAYLGNTLFRQIADEIMSRRADTGDKAGHDRIEAAEEALVELYAAKRTGDFTLLERRYGVKVSAQMRGWQSRLAQVLARLREIVGRLFGFGDAFGDGDLLRLMARLDDADKVLKGKRGSRDFDLAAPKFGQREGLFDLPPVPLTVLSGNEFGENLNFRDTKKMAEHLLRALQQSPVGTLHNDDMGWDLQINSLGRKKMGDNHFLSHETSQAVAGVRDLVKRGVLAETHQDEKHGNTDVVAVHRLYAPVEIAGKLYRVKLTVKDYVLNNGVARKNLHAIEAVEIENAPLSASLTDASKMQGTAQPENGRSISIADLLRGASLNDGNPFDSFDGVSFDLATDRDGFLKNPDAVVQSINRAIGSRVKKGGVRAYLGGKWTDGLKVSLQFLGRRQLTEVYRKLLPQLDRYGDLADKYSADGNRAMIRSDKLVSRWAKLKDKDALAGLMHDATLAQVDADSAVKPELAADMKAWLPLRHRFDKLSPEAQAVYRQARDDYRSHFDGVRAAMEARLRRLGVKAGAVERVRERFSEGMKGVYFPLARFGRYVVVAKNANGATVSVGRAETMGEARTLRESYLRQFPARDGFSVGRVQLAKEYSQSRDAVGTGFLKNALDALSELDLSSEQFAGIEDTLHQLYLQSLPDLSWAKHGIHRKGTAGFSSDAMRAYARNMVHGAGYLAKLRYGDLMTAALDGMQDFSDQRRDDADFDQPVAQRVIDEMRKRHDVMMNPNTGPVAAWLTGAGFVWYLGFSPAAAVVNFSQTPLVAFPMMAAKWGWKKAATELARASGQTAQGLNDIRAQLDDDEQAAFGRAEGDGTIDIGQVHDLIRESGGASSGKTARGFHAFMKAAGWMFQGAERFNRQATFVAAYRLARQAGADAEQAFVQAKDMVFRSHFDYSTENRPRVMQGNWQRVIFLFKQYSQNMIYTLVRNFHQAVAGASKAERAEARKVFSGLMVMHALAAGVLGLPVVGTVLSLLSLLGGDDDEPFDAETALRLWLNEAFGDTVGEVAAKGVSRLTPFDVSGRVGLNNLIFPDVQDGLQGRRWAESFAAGLSGPVVGAGIGLADGANTIADGDWLRGLESMLPVVLRNGLKSVRLAREGHIDKSGVVVKDEIGWGGLAGQFAGFSPSELRLAMEGKAAVMKADRALNTRRSGLLAKFAKASLDGDTEQMARIRGEIAGFNRKHPNRAITVAHLLQSVQNRRRRIAQAQGGVYLPRNRRDAADAGRFAQTD